MRVKCISDKYKRLILNEVYEVTYFNNIYISLFGKGGRFESKYFIQLNEKSGEFKPFENYNAPFRYNYINTSVLMETYLLMCVNDKGVKNLKKGCIYKVDNLNILFSYDLFINNILYNLNRFRTLTKDEIKNYNRIEKIKSIL